MDERKPSDRDADEINDRMAAQIEERRKSLPNRRRRCVFRAPALERRRICAYCFQRGDHRTVADCLRALERVDRIIEADD